MVAPDSCEEKARRVVSKHYLNSYRPSSRLASSSTARIYHTPIPPSFETNNLVTSQVPPFDRLLSYSSDKSKPAVELCQTTERTSPSPELRKATYIPKRQDRSYLGLSMNSTQQSFVRGDKVCRPADWIDVIKFFALNFGLHALTVVTPPGSNGLSSTVFSFLAMILPSSGMSSAISVLMRAPILQETELEVALRSGALCMLIPASIPLLPKPLYSLRYRTLTLFSRTYRDTRIALHEYLIPDSTNIRAMPSQAEPVAVNGAAETATAALILPKQPKCAPYGVVALNEVNTLMTTIHGQYPTNIRRLQVSKVRNLNDLNDLMKYAGSSPPLEYSLVAVPAHFTVRPLLADHVKPTSLYRGICNILRRRPTTQASTLPGLSSNYSFLKTAAAIAQIVYSSYELYQLSDGPIEQYGYAAYGLTVIPYVMMSILNLLANLAAPTYTSRYIVHYRGTTDPSTTPKIKTTNHESSMSPRLAAGTCASVTEDASTMPLLGHGELAEAKGRYPRFWWDVNDRRTVEKSVGGAVGYVYGEFRTSIDLTSLPDSILKLVIISDHGEVSPTHGTGTQILPIRLGLALATSRVLGTRFQVIGYYCVHLMSHLATAVGIALPYIIIGTLTKWEKGNSTPVQRALIMMWIVGGQWGASFPSLFTQSSEHGYMLRRFIKRSWLIVVMILLTFLTVVYLLPSIGGFYMVGKMIINDKACSRL